MIQPLHNRVLIKPFPSDETSAGGLFVPEAYREVSNKVLIVAVGKGTKDKPMTLVAGQTAYRVKGHQEIELEIEGEKHYIIGQEAILATN